MKQLERVYLLNVLIYIKDIDSTRRFLEINHKCREVGHMLRIYTMKQSFDLSQTGYCVYTYPFIPTDIYDLFPKVETIECYDVDIFDASKEMVFNKATKIRILMSKSIENRKNVSKYPHILNKVESVNIPYWLSNLSINLKNYFPNMKKLILVNAKNLL